MKRSLAIILCALAVVACDKHDPILPGERTPIFDTGTVKVLNRDIDIKLPGDAFHMNEVQCKYTQDASNVVWDGERKIFSGFPTNNSVKSNQKPVCSGKYVYAGLTTGELVKINPKTRQIIWIADIYRGSNMTGGASVLDIVAPIVVRENSVYVGGLGDAFCELEAGTGNKKWCVNISVPVAFEIIGNVGYVAAADNYLYAVNLANGDVWWRTSIDAIEKPIYQDGKVVVKKQKFNAKTGK
jgi:outer membrane protein assembly factor BamB